MSLQNLTLVTNKKLTNLQDAVIRQSEKGLTITAIFINEDNSPYDLTNKKVTFNEHKDSDKYVVDTNVQIIDARNGSISYTLHSQCYAATGEAWFEIADASGTVVDSTQNFNLKVKDAANASIYNTNYITQLDQLRSQMQTLVDNADGQLKQQLKTTQDQMNQKLTELGNAYQLAEQGRANAYKQAEANRDNGWSQDKQRIDTEWNQDKDCINGEWNTQKKSIQSTANNQQSSIQSTADSNFKAIGNEWSLIRNTAKSELATIQTNINSLQAIIDNLNKNKIPNLNQLVSAIQDKVTQLQNNLHDINWASFVKSVNGVTPDANGNVQVDTYTKAVIDNKVANAAKVKTVQGQQPDASGNVTLPKQTVIKTYDYNNNTEPSDKKTYSYGDAWLADSAIIKGLISWLPTKYATKNIVNLSTPMFYSTKNIDDFTAMGSPNKAQTLTVYRSDFSGNDDGKPGLANYSQGLIFGAWNGRGVLSISNNTKERKARISGGTYDDSNYPIWSEDIAWKSDLTNYYNKSQIDNKTNNLKEESDSNKAEVLSLRMRCDNLETRCKTLESRCSSLETQLAVLQGQMANLLSKISVGSKEVVIKANLLVKEGNIQNYWGGTDQYVSYSPFGKRRGQFGIYDDGSFHTGR
ncbi:BppU family phage baseplate upper protein [Lactobacillus jensenii]|uniref:BppU family phage baseplate upper protein n=1 Tax=Lactobacillus TaxID=1578 RepID=UPI00118F763E|nr:MULTISPECIES: BppU family phage baseplate upper protein [Lactobacillus]MCW8124748.1 BppU family phage baseplate upper protein [Lactobacillus mulieris]MCZ3690720.1 BppU family phage baseplate upper protein [Lactobacillus mulieris]MCZ3696678.1 BppU family phage baseplate upper protein [Lactobacillus mulieris]MCZ3702580.1 BppU family phage baseplate upper protein [Lactobacillus mulieris]MCZ3704338.1 BppU family phage baseplate upper protein [Lactobacillus mulieris]